MIANESIVGIALENNTAFIEKHGKYVILKSNKENKAYMLKNVDGILKKEEL